MHGPNDTWNLPVVLHVGRLYSDSILYMYVATCIKAYLFELSLVESADSDVALDGQIGGI